MRRNDSTMRRRGAVAAVLAGTLLVLPGCAALSDLTGGAEPTASAEPAAEAPAESSPTPSSPTVTPSEEPSPTPEPSSASPEATTTPSPSASPSADADNETETDADTGAGADDPADDSAADDSAKDDKKDKESKKEKKDAEPEYLQSGASGAEVTKLQSRLQELGYYLPDADGSFGPMTQQAVWALQKAAGLYRDGVVGPKTLKAVEDGVRPGAESSSGKVVEIDLDRQLIKAVEDGKVVRTINASSGNGESYEAKGRTYTATTPRGSYAVYMERDYLHESTLELGAMYRPKYFTGGIAVHGSPSIPPFPASHGCIRVSNSAMDWLWDTWGMPKGTKVVVY